MVSHHDHLRRQADHDHTRKLHRIAGGHVGGAADEREDKKMIREAIHEHDRQLHPGHHTKVKFSRADGGGLMAGGPRSRPRRDRAGAGKGKHHTSVNVIVAPQHGGAGAGATGLPPTPPPMMPPRPPMPPPGMMPPPGGMPGGVGMPPVGAMPRPVAGLGGAGMPPIMPGRKHGGAVSKRQWGGAMAAPGVVPAAAPGMIGRPVAPLGVRKRGGGASYTAGASSGVGRLQKISRYGNKANRGED